MRSGRAASPGPLSPASDRRPGFQRRSRVIRPGHVLKGRVPGVEHGAVLARGRGAQDRMQVHRR